MKIFLDDIREAPMDWQKINNYNDFINFLNENINDVSEISLDHDLGEVKTGYDVCKYIVEHNLWVPNIKIHSANPVGVFNMYQLLSRYAPEDVCILKVTYKN